MRRLVLVILALTAVAAVPSAQACDCGGCPPVSCGTTSTSAGATGPLLVRNFGQSGPLAVYDVTTGRRRFTLPSGRVSADGARYYTARRRDVRTTTLRSYDARSGRLLRTWTHAGGAWRVGGVSANGGLVALVRSASNGTWIELVSARGRVVRRLALNGWFDVDAVSNDGRRLFLVQYARTGYLIRKYDFGRDELAARSLTERGVPMTGTAWDAVADPAGRWLLTLYLRGSGRPEVHTLDLRHGTAVCIDLPGGNGPALQQYVLALGRDGRTLYAANPALGVVASLDLEQRRVIHVAHFRPHPESMSASASAAVSHDGRTIYFTAGQALFAYDAAFGVVRRAAAAGAQIAGLAFGRDDRRLLVVLRDGRSLHLSAATGRRL